MFLQYLYVLCLVANAKTFSENGHKSCENE